MVVLGYDDTLQVLVADLAHHTGAVARGLATSAPDRDEPKPLIVADLPWMSYHTTPVDTLNNAAQLIRAGAQAVKLEGGRKRLPMVEALVDAEIPVMGRSEEHTSALQSLMRISYAVFCLKKKTENNQPNQKYNDETPPTK